MKNILLGVLLLVAFQSMGQSKGINAKITFGKLTSGATTTISEFLAQPGFVSSDPSITVTSFVFSALPSKGDLIGSFAIKGNKLSPEVINLLKTYAAGKPGKIFFDDIKVKTSDGARTVQSILLEYTN